ncbi:MAG: aconitate hydratase AcnA, partial [Planctomycetota bacterium]
MKKEQDSFQTRASLTIGGKEYTIFQLPKLEEQGHVEISGLPYSIRVLLENLLRREDGFSITKEDIERVIHWRENTGQGIAFYPARVILQDFTGVPCVVDLADMRDAMKEQGGDPKKINPDLPVDLVIDHSVQVDFFGFQEALKRNIELEFQRNKERYELLKWGQKSLDNFQAVPPGMGIVHQVNLEYLSKVVQSRELDGATYLYPDSLIGTDSHTTMINGIGVFGFGVGGIEAEAVMLGEPYFMVIPEVIGVKLTGRLPEGATATDLVLTITEMLRKEGVVGKIVEYFGPGLDHLPLPDRATIANMSPEYGATMGFFPVDNQTLDYLRLTNRSHLIEVVEEYTKNQRLFRNPEDQIQFTKTLELDMSSVVPSLAGPKRPQDRIDLSHIKEKFQESLTAPQGVKGFGLSTEDLKKKSIFKENGKEYELPHGSLIIAAITSCTNTSNPSVMLAAGLVAKKAIEKGLEPKPWVKTSLAPGSKVVEEYLRQSGLLKYLEKARFNLVGFGCTTCIGNSGPIPEAVEKALREGDIVAASILSGNRNFEGRIHPLSKANFLASPPLVVLFSFIGRINVDLEKDPIGTDKEGNPVYFKDLWPEQREIQEALNSIRPEMFKEKYEHVFEGDENWNSLTVGASELFSWDPDSTYIRRPPYFADFEKEPRPLQPIENARVLALLGDSVTTDHISPAGAIPKDSPAGKYLMDHGVEPKNFNSFGSRRGNHEVMIRGTFGNI